MACRFVALGALNAFLSVALGAFGAHGLRALLSPRALEVYETGVQYHQMHALALLLIGLLADRLLRDARLVRAAGGLLNAGIVLFSGSLYVLAISGAAAWGAVTPIGGVCFLAGWALLALAAWKEVR